MIQEYVSCNNCNSENHAILTTFRGNEGYGFLGKNFRVAVCKNCGLVFLNPRPSESAYARYYQGGLGSQKKTRLTKNVVLAKKKFQRHYAHWLAQHWGVPKEGRILEVGCGMGAFLYFLKELGYGHVQGIEMGETAAKTAKDILGIPVTVQDFFSHTLPEESFDAVVGIALIEHMMDPRRLIREMACLVKPDGVIYLNTPDLEQFTFRKQFFKFVHTYYFTPTTLTSMLQQEGFEVLHALSVPTLAASSNFLFPENCIPGEMHIIAKKTGAKKPPQKEKYQYVIAQYKKRKFQEFPYVIANKVFLNKYAGALRKLRARFRDTYKKDPKEELEEYFSNLE